MATFAILRNNVVENIIVADNVETAKAVTRLEAVEYTEDNPAFIGWTYVPELGIYQSPNTEETPIE